MKAVMYGAGSIGRGFIGALLSEIGFEVTFIDVNPQVVDTLNRDRSYPQIIMDEKRTVNLIRNVRAVNGRDEDAIIREIRDTDLMATSVGAAILQRIAPLIARGLMARRDVDHGVAFTRVLSADGEKPGVGRDFHRTYGTSCGSIASGRR